MTQLIRKATPKDLKAIVNINMSSFAPKNHLVVGLGARYVEKYYKWFIESSIAFTFVVEEGSQIIGHAAGCNRSYQGIALKQTYREAIWGLITHPIWLFRGQFIGRLIEIIFRTGVIQDGQDAKNMSHLAVLVLDENTRGKGIAVNLLNDVKAENYRRGYSKLRSTIPKDNKASYKMHIRSGFKEIKYLNTKDNIIFEIELP